LEAIEMVGFGIRQQYQQCMIFWNNHALLPKVYGTVTVDGIVLFQFLCGMLSLAI
jgi:hypothetical protein